MVVLKVVFRFASSLRIEHHTFIFNALVITSLLIEVCHVGIFSAEKLIQANPLFHTGGGETLLPSRDQKAFILNIVGGVGG